MVNLTASVHLVIPASIYLREIYALYDTIVIDEDGFCDLNDRLILGFKGTISEAELHFLCAHLIYGKKNKVHK